MADEEVIDIHESYGMISLHKVSGHAVLFGSSVDHQNFISLTISRAERKRNIHVDWVHSADELIRINLSHAQLSELLFSVGSSGVPCTLDRCMVGGLYKSMERCPGNTKAAKYLDEFKRDMVELSKNIGELSAEAKAQAEGNPNKSDRRALASKIEHVMCEIQNNMPFILDCFIEKVEDVVKDAKAEIDIAASEAGLKKMSGELKNVLPELVIDDTKE